MPAPAPSGSIGLQLEELAELHQSGALNDAEFAQVKARILSGS